MSIEINFDVPFIAALALKEKQIQQNYRPIIAVHKLFSRRPGTLFRGLILSEFGNTPLKESFFRANDFPSRVVADPFMGGGTPLLEANRMGCDVFGFDINPMATWIVREEMEHLDLEAYLQSANNLIGDLEESVGPYYRTDCPIYGDRDVPVKYFLWVKILDCSNCGLDFDLFPGHLVAQNRRHPRNVVICAECGELNEVENLGILGKCRACNGSLRLEGPAKRNRCACSQCGHVNVYPRPYDGPPRHRLFAIEYYNPRRKNSHIGRFFKKPDAKDLARVGAAMEHWQTLTPQFVPEQAILPGDETDRLHRWGYGHYRELFNDRQLLSLEVSCREIAGIAGERIRHALATNLSDLLRYQNMLCRYDSMALKSLDIFSVHGFPVGLIQCESNILGIGNSSGTPVGSGGWKNIIEKYAKAKRYCDSPFETQQKNGRKVTIPIEGEWIGERLNGSRRRLVSLHCASCTDHQLEPNSLDAVFTDPPYFGNVQYGELMDFCYVWLRRLVGKEAEGFDRESSRSADELTGNETEARGLDHFAEGLGTVYRGMARALKSGAPLAFTFHHNKMEAYYAVGTAILDAGLVCSATIPCPAEMGGSIHIHGTGSSIIDTIFVCRTHGTVRRGHLFRTTDQLAGLLRLELDQLRSAGLKPSPGDIRCMVYGHLTRMAIWNLRLRWDFAASVPMRLALFAEEVADLPEPSHLIATLTSSHTNAPLAEPAAPYREEDTDVVSF